jgi:hypothetical protein
MKPPFGLKFSSKIGSNFFFFLIKSSKLTFVFITGNSHMYVLKLHVRSVLLKIYVKITSFKNKCQFNRLS